MKHSLATLAVAILATATVSQPATAQDQASGGLSILAAGDSYAAGEGLPNIQTGEQDCQRALGLDAEGDETPSKAWPVLTKEFFEQAEQGSWDVDTFWFTACTGNLSTQFVEKPTRKGVSQLEEATDDSRIERWDVITASFGGNDIGFANILTDCIGFDDDLLDPEVGLFGLGPSVANGLFAGCSQTESDMKALITEGLPSELERLYNEFAGVASQGGLIVITGYPHLVAEPSIWSAREKLMNRCNRLSEGDARSLRGATGHLNATIEAAVSDAASRHPNQTWVFVDIMEAFEPTWESTHALCGPDEWLNGFSFAGITDGDMRGLDGTPWELTSAFSRSFHPNQAGHDGYARAVVAAIETSGWSPTSVVAAPGSDSWPENQVAGSNDKPLGALRAWFATLDEWAAFEGDRFGLADCAEVDYSRSHCYTEVSTGERHVYLIGAPESHIDMGVLVEQVDDSWVVTDSAPYVSPGPSWLSSVTELPDGEGAGDDADVENAALIAVQVVLFDEDDAGLLADGDRTAAIQILLDLWGPELGASNLQDLAANGSWSFIIESTCGFEGSARRCEVQPIWAADGEQTGSAFLPAVSVLVDQNLAEIIAR